MSAALGAHPSADLAFDDVAAVLAPGCSEPAAKRILLVFAFAQWVHYSVWLDLVPRAARPAGAWPLRRAITALAADLGRPGLAVVALSAALPLPAMHDPVAGRAAYLSVVVFHGWLDLALLPQLALGRAGRWPR